MKIFNVDLDNTIIYSYKHDIGKNIRNVELYEGREISFITERTYDLLKKVSDMYLVVPTSTRTIEQYNRVNLGIGNFEYALVCNGGILLRNGQRDEAWYKESLELICESEPELRKAQMLLNQEDRRYFELRFIESLFIFTKCKEPECIVNDLKGKLDLSKVDVFCNGDKVYVVPCDLSKGMAIKRLKKILQPEYIVAAGDSEFDISMVEAADKGLVSYGFKKKFNVNSSVYEMNEQFLFSESVLEECIKMEKQ